MNLRLESEILCGVGLFLILTAKLIRNFWIIRNNDSTTRTPLVSLGEAVASNSD
jgi:hypothetical protein